MLKNMSLFKV